MKKSKLIISILIFVLLLFSACACEKKTESFAFESGELTLEVGETQELKFEAYPQDRQYSLQVDNPSIVALEGNQVEGLRVGITYIRAYSGEFSSTLKLIVQGKGATMPDVDIYYTIFFNSDRGVTPANITVLSGTLAQRPTDMVDIGGYVFTGWYTDKQNTQLFDFENDIIDNNIELYAGWIINSNIKFNYTTQDEKWVISGFYYNNVPYESVELPLHTPELIDYGKMEIAGIGTGAFEANDTLVEIVIPSTYEVIGEEAFANATNLKKVTFAGDAEALVTIENKVFYNCTALEEIVGLPNSITSIGELAFYNTVKLIDFAFPNAVEEIKEKAFYDSGITSADIWGATTIRKQAFAYSKLEQFVYTENLVEIGVDAFFATPWQNGILQQDNYLEINNILLKVNLNTFTMPENIEKVIENCFASSGVEISLKNKHMPLLSISALPESYDIIIDDKNDMGEYQNFYPTEISNNIWCLLDFTTQDNKYTFELLEKGTNNNIVIKSCTTQEYSINLTEIFQDKSIVKIRRTAFSASGCANLQIVHLPSNAGQVSTSAFNTTIRALFIDQIGSAILQLEGNPVNTILPAGFDYKVYVSGDKRQAYINAYKFWNSNNIFDVDNIVVEDDLYVNIVEDKAYIVQYLGFATELVIENKYNGYPLAEISTFAFCGNKTLEKITIPNSADNIVLKFGDYAFYYMNNDMQFIIKRTSPPSLGANAFGVISASNYAIYVLPDYIADYKTAWSTYKDIIYSIS